MAPGVPPAIFNAAILWASVGGGSLAAQAQPMEALLAVEYLAII